MLAALVYNVCIALLVFVDLNFRKLHPDAISSLHFRFILYLALGEWQPRTAVQKKFYIPSYCNSCTPML